jgi:SAM-dependent methyltransferase
VASDSAAPKQKILDVGCGWNKTPGAIGIDSNPRTHADVIHDLGDVPYPFADNEFDQVICRHVIEHVPDVMVFVTELYRISKPGGLITIVTPHYTNPDWPSDPTHRNHFNCYSFRCFVKDSAAPCPRAEIDDRNESEIGNAANELPLVNASCGPASKASSATNGPSRQRGFMRSGPFEFYSNVSLRPRRVYVSLANLWRGLGIEWLVNLDQRWPGFRFTRKFWEFYLSAIVRGKELEFEFEVIK